MELLTKEIEQRFLENPLYSHEEEDDPKVIVKYFNPCGAGIWLITEAEKLEDGDWLLFGYMHIHCWEWEYVLLSQLESIVGPLGLGIERDLYVDGRTVKELAL